MKCLLRNGVAPWLAGSIVMAFAASTSAEEAFDYFENSWSVIGLKDYDDGTRVTPSNELLLAEKQKYQLSLGRHATPLSRKQTKTLLDGRLPVVLLTAEQGPIRYDFKFWATPLPTAKDWQRAFDWPTEGENFLNWIWMQRIDVWTWCGRPTARTEN